MRSLSFVVIALSVASCDAFVQSVSSLSARKSSLAAAAPDAQALSDYMAKSHEEKLRAVKDIEDKKNAEIQVCFVYAEFILLIVFFCMGAADTRRKRHHDLYFMPEWIDGLLLTITYFSLWQALKNEVQRLQQSSPSSSAISTSAPGLEGSMEELHAKLVAYQQFMSQYIVKAQEEKVAAVKAAEAAASKKYEEKLQQLLLSGGSTAPSTPASTAAVIPASTSTTENKLYMERNVKVSEAAKAGKSRWGDMETKRAAEQVVGMTPAAVNGAAATAAASAPAAAAAQAPVVVTLDPVTAAEVKEADHGLRADGGVGGPSLAERVAMGANEAIMGAAAPATPTVSRNKVLYHERNAMVSAAAKAGKSRWGPMEVEKAEQLASLPIAAASAPAVAASPQVAAADHGLQAAGAPSLAERVNLGAQLLGS